MRLDLTRTLTRNEWLRGRDMHPAKVQQARWIDRFNEALSQVETTSRRSVAYMSGPDMTYIEGTPVFHWFKLTRSGFFIGHGYDDETWKSYPVRPDIREILHNTELNKWDVEDTALDIEPGYILFPVQVFSSQIKLIAQTAKWATDNKQRVLIRPHPYPRENVDEHQIWDRMVSRLGLNEEYVQFSGTGNINALVKGCKAVWSSNSGVGLPALLQNKPVAYFLKDFDHTYGNVATFCKTVEDAAQAPPPCPEDVDRFFSWYYDTVVIDLQREECVEDIQRRIDGVQSR